MNELDIRASAVDPLLNQPDPKLVAVSARASNGTLTPSALVSAGGLGMGEGPDHEGLPSQGALILGPGQRTLDAVHGGSGDISVFSVVR